MVDEKESKKPKRKRKGTCNIFVDDDVDVGGESDVDDIDEDGDDQDEDQEIDEGSDDGDDQIDDEINDNDSEPYANKANSKAQKPKQNTKEGKSKARVAETIKPVEITAQNSVKKGKASKELKSTEVTKSKRHKLRK